MGGGVDYYRENGIGRVIDRDEALAILKRADAEGLVLQPSNAKRIANICMCCGCCCGVLRTIKTHPRPAEFVASPFRVALDATACSDCGVCLTRCPMDALVRDDAGKICARSPSAASAAGCASRPARAAAWPWSASPRPSSARCRPRSSAPTSTWPAAQQAQARLAWPAPGCGRSFPDSRKPEDSLLRSMGEEISMKPRLSSFASVRTFLKVGTCSEAMGHVLDRAFDHPSKPEEHATAPLAGGILQHGYQCGLIWGAALAAGAQAYRCFGAGPEAEAAALRASQSLVSSFRTQNGEINCLELTECDWRKPSKVMKYFLKGGTIKCFRMAARFPPAAYDDILKATAEHPTDAPVSPVSCTAELARRLGASDLQAMMVAGWAGGIGLSGGACGALAVAVWMSGLARLKSGDRRVKMADPAASKIVDRFVPSADYEFECSKIVGRTFTERRRSCRLHQIRRVREDSGDAGGRPEVIPRHIPNSVLTLAGAILFLARSFGREFSMCLVIRQDDHPAAADFDAGPGNRAGPSPGRSCALRPGCGRPASPRCRPGGRARTPAG